MAVSSSTFSNAGGAVSDLFAGEGAEAQGSLQAQGLQISAEGTLINAQGTEITAESLDTQAGGNLAESQNYDLAAQLADANAAYTVQSTAIQEQQLQRQITQTIGTENAGVAASGFSSGGSAGDILRSSQQQGTLAKTVLQQQGLITEAGYNEQAASFRTLSAAGQATAASEEEQATQTRAIAVDQQGIAAQQQQLATATQNAANNAATGDFISSALKGVAAVASLVAAPATGGASLALGGLVMGGGSPSGYRSG